MARRRRNKESDRQVKVSTLEKNIAYLHANRFAEGSKNEEARQSLVRQFISRDTLTRKQQYYVKILCRTLRRAEKLDQAAKLNDRKTAKELGWL